MKNNIKALFLALPLVALVSACQTTQSGVAGVYKGVVPCADCLGIETKVTLYPNGEFAKTDTYLGKGGEKFTEGGTYVKGDKPNTLLLTNGNEAIGVYAITPKGLVMYSQGSAGKPNPAYELIKQSGK